MTFQDDKKGEQRRKADAADAKAKPSEQTSENEEISTSADRPRKRNLPASNVGDALKSAYQRTLDENVPPEMLDLLGKLR